MCDANRDISNPKQLDPTLAEEKTSAAPERDNRLHYFVESIPGLVLALNVEGRATSVSSELRQYTGLETDQMLGDGWLQILHPDERTIAARATSFRYGREWKAEIRLRRNDGAYRSHLYRCKPIREETGPITAWCGTFTDVEDYKLAAAQDRNLKETLERQIQDRTAQLRQRQQSLRMVIEGVKDYAILMLDSQGRVASWSGSAERIKGYFAEEIVGKSFACFYTPEDIHRGAP